jgi:hypothetical protein
MEWVSKELFPMLLEVRPGIEIRFQKLLMEELTQDPSFSVQCCGMGAQELKEFDENVSEKMLPRMNECFHGEVQFFRTFLKDMNVEETQD